MAHDTTINDGRTGAHTGAAKAAPDVGDVLPVPLSKPLATHKGEVRQIDVRVPDFGDFIEIGEIESVLKTGETPDGQPILKSSIDRERLMRWMVKLTGIDRAILSTLPPLDAYRVSLAVTKVVEIFSVGNFKGGPTN